jgi:hypothetical protein
MPFPIAFVPTDCLMATIGERRVRGRLAGASLVVGTAAFISAGLGSVACDRAPSPARADTAPAQPRPPGELPVVAAKPAPTPPPSAGTPATSERIIDVIADKAAYPVPLAAAAKRFAAIATLTRESPAPEVVLLAGSGPGVRRLEVGYTEDARGRWVFSQATMLLAPSPPDDLAALHRQLESALRKKLGKPKFTKKGDAPLPQMGWKLGGRVELWLEEETSTLPGGSSPERHLRVDVAAPVGEAE